MLVRRELHLLKRVVLTKYYGEDSEVWYSDHILLSMLEEVITPESRVLDAGAGTGEKFAYTLKERAKEVVGVDLDPRVETNCQLHRGIISGLYEIPIEDNYFDVIFCRYVMEHVDEPNRFAGEIQRVLKPGGCFVFLTPQQWHYVCLIARLTPQWFHKYFNEKFRGRASEDTFPTLYRLNTVREINRAMTEHGMRLDRVVLRETCPGYLQWSTPTLLAGIAYERIVNSSEIFSRLRVHIVGKYLKER
jgi:SAM-dependent methyltransferase